MHDTMSEARAWDLSPLYSGSDDPRFDADLQEAKKRAPLPFVTIFVAGLRERVCRPMF